ncbi:hypothetical protein BV898_17685 [Hypsibius exemplaris]|uniref:Uncharacterized protein n=1 Tax=Hypsibius exemplaris TaxID=2072580 RepID=A0A9X6NIG4_HYPEX|nr:hypothetical protein BV898_17685 [Hypsibius exemplaris]
MGKSQHCIMWFQVKVLRVFGLISSSYRTVFRVIGLAAITGSWTMMALQLIDYVIRLQPGQRTPPVLTFICRHAPFYIAMTRGALILTVTFASPENLCDLLQGIEVFVEAWSKFRPIQSKQRKSWDRKATRILLGFGTCWACWETIIWAFDIISKFGVLNWHTVQGYMNYPSYKGITDHILTWHYVILYALFVTVPRFISLQLSICVAVASILLRDGVALLVNQLHVGTHTRAIGAFRQVGKAKKPLAFITEGIEKDREVTSLVRFYEAITNYNVCLNDTIGVTFWLLYWLDLFALMAHVAFFLAAENWSVMMLIETGSGVVVHLVFLLLMVQPVAAAYEKGQRRQMTQHKSLMTFANSLKTRPVILDGNGLLHGDRHAIVFIFSVILSFAIIGKEILSATPLPMSVESFVSTNAYPIRNATVTNSFGNLTISFDSMLM